MLAAHSYQGINRLSVWLDVVRQIYACLSFYQEAILFAQFFYRLCRYPAAQITLSRQFTRNYRTYPDYTPRWQSSSRGYPDLGSNIGERPDLDGARSLTVMSP